MQSRAHGGRTKSGGGRPQEYRTVDGERVPGVTTVLSRFKDSGGLIRWAWKMGRDGKDLDEARDSAASIGSIVHDAIEAFLLSGGELDAMSWVTERCESDAQLERVRDGVSGFLEWWQGMRVEVLETEVPLVSDVYRFGGTLDAVGRINGKLCLIDWKTSNGTIYADYLCQLGAYDVLWTEHRGKPFEGFHLLRASKNTGGFSHHYFRNLDRAARMFLTLREAFDYDAEVKALLK